jgi:hypothetical protein
LKDFDTINLLKHVKWPRTKWKQKWKEQPKAKYPVYK